MKITNITNSTFVLEMSIQESEKMKIITEDLKEEIEGDFGALKAHFETIEVFKVIDFEMVLFLYTEAVITDSIILYRLVELLTELKLNEKYNIRNYER